MLWVAFVSFIGGVALFKSAQYLPWLTTLLGICLFAVTGFKKTIRFKKKFIFIMLIIAGALYAAYRHQPPVSFGGKKHIEASLTGYASFPAKQKYGFSQSFRVTGFSPLKTDNQEKIPRVEDVRIYTQIPLSPLRLYRISVKLSLPSPDLNPGSPDLALRPRAEVLRSVSCGAAPWPERLRSGLDRYYAENFPQTEAGLLMAITTGERSMLDWQTRRSFSRCGLAHLISIAGMHFGIFSLSIFLLVRVLIGLFPLKWLERITLHISPKQIAALASFPLLSGYLLLSGMRVPAVRAYIMISFFLLGLLISRKRAWQTTLAFAALLLVLLQPDVIFDLSFELSFLSVLLIGLFASGAKEKNENGGEKTGVFRFIKKYMIRVVFLSVSITAGLMPLIAYYFHRVQLISPAANLAAVPVAGFLLVPVAVLSGFMYLVSGWYPLPFLSGWLASVSIHMAGFFSSIPHVCPRVAAFPAGFLLVFYGFLAAWLYSKKRIYIALAVLPFVLWAGLRLSNSYLLKKQQMAITFLDDGAGESAVAELPDGKTAVIDTGVNGRETSGYLGYKGKNKIDYLVLSNARRGNTGGAAYLASRYKVGQIWDNGMFVPGGGMLVSGGGAPMQCLFGGIPEEKLSRGQYIEGRDGTGSYRITVLHPYAGFFPLPGPLPLAVNNSSLVLKIQDRWGRSALFTGDIGQAAQKDMMRLGGLLHCDVCRVPYHGQGSASWSPFLSAVHPQIAVVAGAAVTGNAVAGGNYSGPPGQGKTNILGELPGHGARFLSTGTDGAVKASFDEKGIHIKTWKDMGLRENPAGFGEELHNLRVLFSSW